MALKPPSDSTIFGSKHDLCHLCPLRLALANTFTNRTLSCPHHQAPSWLAQWQTHLETGFCPHHQALAWLAPSMWFGIVWKQARFWGHISSSGWKEMRHLCGILWLGRLRDVGRYEGLAPSMWAFPAWFGRMSGTCAIYVPRKAAWCWGKKKMGGKPAQEIATNRSFLGTYMARTTCLKMELRHLSPVFLPLR